MARIDQIKVVEPDHAHQPKMNDAKPAPARLNGYKEPDKEPEDDGIFSKGVIPLALGGGGALLAHSIASSLLDKSEEEKRKESIWSKLIRTLIPLGAGAAGAYAGHRLGVSLGGGDMLKSSQTLSTNDWHSVTSDSGKVTVDTPKEYSDQVGALLDLLYREHNEGDLVGEDGTVDLSKLKERADEIAKRKDSLSLAAYGVGTEALPWAEFVTGGLGVRRLMQGAAQMYTGRNPYIAEKYLKEMASRQPPPRPQQPAIRLGVQNGGSGETNTWLDRIKAKWNEAKAVRDYRKAVREYPRKYNEWKEQVSPAMQEARKAVSDALTNDMRDAVGGARGKFKTGLKNVGKGLGWGALTVGLDQGRRWLDSEVQRGKDESQVGSRYSDIHNKLQQRIQAGQKLVNQK